MAIFSLSTTSRTNSFFSRLKTFLNLTKFNHSLGEVGSKGQLNPEMDSGSTSQTGQFKISKWQRLDSREMGIARSMIPEPPWIVLKVLQNAGFEAYLVGGCVRDLLLNRVPKDYDVITTANLPQIKKKFRGSIIIGRRFPICKVNVKGSAVEVSSFVTVSKTDKGKEEFSLPSTLKGLDHRDIYRWRNCMHRDFTVNSLFFDPFANKIYDYANAVLDIRSSKLRTLVSAEVSFKEDCARILRGLRLAARLNFSFSKEADSAIHKHSSSILSLAKSRILMEVDYMLSFGAAEASIYLLQRYHLLEILLPVQAAHLAQHDRIGSGQSPLMLMKLLSNLDRLVSCKRPSHGCLWVAILTFHLALINNPQQALVVLTFASLLYHGSWDQGVRFARQHAEEALLYVPEISDCSRPISDDELGERISQFAKVVNDTVHVFTETDSLREAMMQFPRFSFSDLVFVTKKMGSHVKDIFNILNRDVTTLDMNRHSLEIDYGFLLSGKHSELRFVLGKIILNTLGCGIASEGVHNKEEKDGLHVGKRHSTGKKVNKRPAVPTSSKQKQGVRKKQKVMASNNHLSEGATNNHELITDKFSKDVPIKEQDFFKEDGCLQTPKKHQARLAEDIDTTFKNDSNKMQKMRKTHESRINSMQETVKCEMTQSGQLIKDQKKPGNNHQENKKITSQKRGHSKDLQQQYSSEQSESVGVKADKRTTSQTKDQKKTDDNHQENKKITSKKRGHSKDLRQQYSSEQSESVGVKTDKRTTLSQTKEAPKEDVSGTGKQANMDHTSNHRVLSSLFR